MSHWTLAQEVQTRTDQAVSTPVRRYIISFGKQAVYCAEMPKDKLGSGLKWILTRMGVDKNRLSITWAQWTILTSHNFPNKPQALRAGQDPRHIEPRSPEQQNVLCEGFVEEAVQDFEQRLEKLWMGGEVDRWWQAQRKRWRAPMTIWVNSWWRWMNESNVDYRTRKCFAGIVTQV